MNIYMDNYGYMRNRKTGKIYDWQVKPSLPSSKFLLIIYLIRIDCYEKLYGRRTK